MTFIEEGALRLSLYAALWAALFAMIKPAPGCGVRALKSQERRSSHKV